MKEALGIRLKKKSAAAKARHTGYLFGVEGSGYASVCETSCRMYHLYALSPIDLVPDVIPVLGLLDDVILLPALILLAIRLIPEDIWERNRLRAAEMKQQRMETRWYFALPVLALWLLLFFLIIKVLAEK